MSEKLQNGFMIKLIFGGTARVEKYLAEGGQGCVYIVDIDGEKKALKWYKKEFINNFIKNNKSPQIFYDNIKENIQRGTPSKEFLWPQNMSEWVDGTFGYIMDLRPEGYYEVTDFMLRNVTFQSFKTVIDAAIHIVTAYRMLHNSGYAYQDLNDGNFFINPQNGKILICDNDNVAPEKMETGILGKPRYIAPEIVMGKNKPDSYSDRFSMAVILYILFTLNHPLEGKKYLVPALTKSDENKLYGEEALFMMDKENQENGPDPKIHKNSLIVWNALPEYMRDIFYKAFCQKGLFTPSARPAEIDWLTVLTRFRSEIVSCDCGRELFTENGKNCKCVCGRRTAISFKLAFGDYSIPAIKGTRIYKVQIGTCDANEALNPVGLILEKKNESRTLGLKNKSGKSWNAVTSKGVARKVSPDEVIPMKAGITFTIGEEEIKIQEN